MGPRRAALLVQHAMYSFYNIGTIPRRAGWAWERRGSAYDQRLLNTVFPGERDRLLGTWKRVFATNYARPFASATRDVWCCAAVSDVVVNEVNHYGSSLYVRAKASFRLREIGLSAKNHRRGFFWQSGSWRSWVGVTFRWRTDRWLAVDWTGPPFRG